MTITSEFKVKSICKRIYYICLFFFTVLELKKIGHCGPLLVK